MANVYHSLLLLITGASQKELARQVRYLKVENEVLRSKLPKRITITPKERQRLVRFAEKLGTAVRRLTTIVSPDTLMRWIREEKKAKKRQPAKRGRRRTPEQICQLVLKLARENQWGYTRILGELKKLGIHSISRNTVKRILKEAGLDPGPKRGEGTWDEFLSRHAKTLVQCDFLNKRIWTASGIRDVFVLVFLHVQTRRAFITPVTCHPDDAWVREQTEAFLAHAKAEKLSVTMAFHDRDTKFTAALDGDLAKRGIEVRKTAYRSPNTNAFVERFIQTVQQECLDHFLIFGERHFNYLVTQWLEHYHEERPHQAKENEPLKKPKKRGRPKKNHGPAEPEIVLLSEIRCKQRLGGLLKSYSRKAA